MTVFRCVVVVAVCLLAASADAQDPRAVRRVRNVLARIVANKDAAQTRTEELILQREQAGLGSVASLVRSIGVAGNVEVILQWALQMEDYHWETVDRLMAAASAYAIEAVRSSTNRWFRTLPAATQRNELARYFLEQMQLIARTGGERIEQTIEDRVEYAYANLHQVSEQIRRLHALALREPWNVTRFQRELEGYIEQTMRMWPTLRKHNWAEISAIIASSVARIESMLEFTTVIRSA